MNRIYILFVVIAVVLMGGCASPSRLGMVKDPHSGLQFGSVVEKNIFIDSSQFQNRTLKIVTRNTSGDGAYQLGAFTGNLKNAFSSKGYIPTDADTFGIKVDLNVLYSGQIQQNMSSQYGFLGGAAGALSGNRSSSPGATASGLIVGATLGSILGSYITEDTYMIVAEVSIGVTDSVGETSDKKTITFGSSPKMQEEKIAKNFRPFREVLRTKISVFAGGTNTSQQQIAEQVKQRLVSIVSDSI